MKKYIKTQIINHDIHTKEGSIRFQLWIQGLITKHRRMVFHFDKNLGVFYPGKEKVKDIQHLLMDDIARVSRQLFVVSFHSLFLWASTGPHQKGEIQAMRTSSLQKILRQLMWANPKQVFRPRIKTDHMASLLKQLGPLKHLYP